MSLVNSLSLRSRAWSVDSCGQCRTTSECETQRRRISPSGSANPIAHFRTAETHIASVSSSIAVPTAMQC